VEGKMSTSPSSRPHRRVRSVPIPLTFHLTPLTIPHPGTPTSHPITSSQQTAFLSIQTRKPRQYNRTPPGLWISPSTHSTSGPYEDHPSIEIKRSQSTFFVSSGRAATYDWTWRAGARVTAESLEEQGRSWLVSRASSTDVKDLPRDAGIEDEHDGGETFVGDFEALGVEDTVHGHLIDDYEAEDLDAGISTWLSWFRAMIELGDEEDEDEELNRWTPPPKRRVVAFAESSLARKFDDGIAERARERDEDHGLDGWMDGAAYLAFLGLRAMEGFF